MVMKIKIHIAGIIALMMVMIPSLHAQTAEYGVWLGVEGEKKITKRIDADFNLQARTFDNGTSMAQWLAETGLTYEACKYVDLALMYRFIADYKDNDGVEYKHRWYGDVKGKIDINRFELSSRIRYQQQYNITKSSGVETTIRNKWTLEYNINKCPVSPFVSAEAFAPADDAQFDIEEWRYMIGMTWKINKKQSFEAAWLSDREDGESINLNVLSLSWKNKF